jgi:hypothetical protein
MKTQKILLLDDKNNNEGPKKKIRYDKLLKSFLVVIIFSGMTLLTSCLIFVPFHGHGRRR